VTALREWAAIAADALADANPELPDALNDRAAEAWEPLLAIADNAGHGWPEAARRAALGLSGDEESDEFSKGTMILAKSREAIGGRDGIGSDELAKALNEDDELPFGGWNAEAGIRQREIARLLKPYGIKSRDVKALDGRSVKGYKAADMREAWDCYLPPPEEGRQGRQGRWGDETGDETPDKDGASALVADVAPMAGREQLALADPTPEAGAGTMAPRPYSKIEDWA
jgi:hypothetical protein